MTVEFQTLIAQVEGRSTLVPIMGRAFQWDEVLSRRRQMVERWLALGLIPSEGWNAPLGIQLELTYRCNMECLHCYNDSRASRVQTELSDEEWSDVARQAADMKVLNAVISGGEPFLRLHAMFRVMDILHAVGTHFVLITNGWFVAPELVERLKKYHFSWIQVSIDGSRPELHDMVRQKPGSWKRAVQAAKMFIDAGLPTTIAHVVTPISVDYVEEMCDLAALLGARQLFCDRPILVGRAASNRDQTDLSPEREEGMRQSLLSKQNQYLHHMIIKPAADPALSLRSYVSEPAKVCLVRPNGDVKLDCIAPFVFGNVRRASLCGIWKEMRFGWNHPDVLGFVQRVRGNRDLIAQERGVPHLVEDAVLFDYSAQAGD